MIRSVYLTTEEEAELVAFAEHHGASVNFAVRAAVRLLVGLPVPRGLAAAPRGNVEPESSER